MPLEPGHFYEFGPFLLSADERSLKRDGNTVSLTPKTLALLNILVENGGRLLTKEELMKALWPDSFVEEANLPQQISTLRKLLGETAGQDRFIVTVPGKGYRFATTVIRRTTEPTLSAQVDAGIESAEHPGVEPTTVPSAGSRRQASLYVTAACIAAVALAYFGYTSYARPKKTEHEPRSLAVLPLQSLRNDASSEFLGVSLADAVITKLGYVSAITVRPSSSIIKYRNQQIDIQKAAADLHVNTLLTGNYVRDGDDLRITSQLVDVRTENILWKGSFDLKYEKLLTVHDRVAEQIIKGLELSIPAGEAERLKPEKQIDPRAYEYFLRGVDLYSRSEFPLAIQMLERSIEIDPGYALTWAHLGRARTANGSFELGGREEYRKAQAAYEKALALQPTLMEAQVYLANLLTDTGKVELAVPPLRRALETNSNYAEAHWELGYAYRFAGMLEQSVQECERARQLDPGVKLTSSALNSYLYLGEYDRFLDSLPRYSDSPLILFYRGLGEYYKRDWLPAKRDFSMAFDMRPTLLQAKLEGHLPTGWRIRVRRGWRCSGKPRTRCWNWA